MKPRKEIYVEIKDSYCMIHGHNINVICMICDVTMTTQLRNEPIKIKFNAYMLK